MEGKQRECGSACGKCVAGQQNCGRHRNGLAAPAAPPGPVDPQQAADACRLPLGLRSSRHKIGGLLGHPGLGAGCTVSGLPGGPCKPAGSGPGAGSSAAARTNSEATGCKWREQPVRCHAAALAQLKGGEPSAGHCINVVGCGKGREKEGRGWACAVPSRSTVAPYAEWLPAAAECHSTGWLSRSSGASRTTQTAAALL